MLRLFIAIDLNTSSIESLQDICFGVKGIRWVPTDQLHCTLRFIGSCEEPLFYQIRETLEKVTVPAFTLNLKGVGYFPPRGKPRILWAGVTPQEELISLRSAIDKVLRSAGIQNEGKKFHPHITLGRLKGNNSAPSIIPFLTQNSLFRTETFSVERFHLYSSILRPQGAQHRIEETYTLL